MRHGARRAPSSSGVPRTSQLLVEQIERAVLELVKRAAPLPRVEFQLVGAVSDPAVLAAFDGLPIRVLDVGGSSEYPAFVPWMAEHLQWDLAIAPLEDDPFTRCKSDIKFLDYGWLGVPAK
jgi:hypothetical protein